MIRNLPAMQETQLQFLNREDPLENGLTTHSSILALRIPWTEEPGRLQFMGDKWFLKHEQASGSRFGVGLAKTAVLLDASFN